MGKDNTIEFKKVQELGEEKERIEIVTKDFYHDINAGLVTGAVKADLKNEWTALFKLELAKYIASGAKDHHFIDMKAYLLSILFNLTSGITVPEAWEMLECLSLPEEMQKEIIPLAIKFSPRGNDLRLHIMRENARKNIRVAK